jgi:hypothetical protein
MSDTRNDERTLTEMVEGMVDQGASAAEEIHREIADLPLSVLERIGVFGRTAVEIRSIQDQAIGAVYRTVRDVNHRVTRLAQELLEERPPEAEAEAK